MFASLIDAVIVVIRMKACRRRQRNNFVTHYFSKRELTSDRTSSKQAHLEQSRCSLRLGSNCAEGPSLRSINCASAM
jgi:hypothetical protein